LKKAIEEWEQKYVLKAEMDGKVTFLDVWAKNQWIQAGQHVFTVIPQASTDYVAKLKIPAFNTGKLKVGQTVHLKLINYPESEFGILSGTVSKISLTPNAENQYLLDVAVEAPLITSYKKQIPFTQEMQATADIITEDLRLIQRLFYQFNKLIKR
jgi:multidrug resistance efflux pump